MTQNHVTLRSVGLLILLTGLGCLGNRLSITLFFGADFIFGSIAGLIIISLYGLRLGLLANLIICSQTYFLWGHPYAIVTFFSESLFVGLFLRYRKMNLPLLDGLFWVIIGMPLGVLLHTTLLPTNASAIILLILKQAINGVFNALFAGLAVNHLPFLRVSGLPDTTKSISLHESTFSLLTALVLIPTFLIVIQDGRKEMASLENELIDNLQELSTDITNHLHPWYWNRLHMLGALAESAGRTEMMPSRDLQHDTELIMRGYSDLRGLYIANAKGSAITHEPPVNERGESTIGTNYSDRPYFQRAQLKRMPVLSEVFMGRGGIFSPILSLCVPVIKEGKFSGVVTGALDLTKIGEILDPYGKDRGANITLLDSGGRIIATTDPNRETMQLYDRKTDYVPKEINESIKHMFPAKVTSSMSRWRKSFYVLEEQVSADIPWTMIIEFPAAPLQERLQSTYLRNFSTMSVLVIVALVFAHFIHRWGARPLEELAEVTTDLPSKLVEQRRIEWPKSSAAEIQYLISNFRSMAESLSQNFHELKARSTELAVTNGELKTEIDERKRVEATLVGTSNFLQRLIQASPLSIIVLDGEYNVKVWNHAAEQTFGWAESEVVGHPLPYLPADENFPQLMDDARGKGDFLTARESRGLRKDGTLIDVSIWTAPLLDSQNEIVGTIGLLADVSEMKKNQEDLRGSEAKFKRLYQEFEALLDAIPDDIALLSPELKVIWANSQAATRFAKDPNELIGNYCHDLWDCRDSEFNSCPVRKSFRTDEPASAHITTNKGKIYESRSVPVRDENGETTNVIEVIRDITEQRKIERQLQQSQKMESIGTLAGGIAHDFNNMLGIISGYVELVRMEAGESDEIRENLEQVSKACNRAKELVRQILAFSRQNKQEREPLQVGLIVKEVLKLLRASLPATIEIRQAIRSTGIVIADPSQIHQVIMNLCTNAHYAMHENGGLLEVSLKDAEIDSSSLDNHPGLKRTGSYLQLTVTDTGQGMNSSTLERIFDPFFTTKEPGEGTGMGLAVVHGIVDDLGGAIEVHSQLGSGTTFDVFIPRADEALEEAGDPVVADLPAGSERILFVDDEEALAAIGGKMLTMLGYRATISTSGVEALELFKSHPDQFDLVVTDMTMPKMTGLVLAKEILAIRPEIPIIMCTGFSEAGTEERTEQFGVRKLLMKPIDNHKLATVLRETLDKPS